MTDIQQCARSACRVPLTRGSYQHKHNRDFYCHACAVKINAACPEAPPFDLAPVRYDLKTLTGTISDEKIIEIDCVDWSKMTVEPDVLKSWERALDRGEDK